MKTTTTFGFPYPEPPDHTRTWEYWQGLAEAVDAMLAAKVPYVRADGSLAITTAGVTRPIPFAQAGGMLSFSLAGADYAQVLVTFPAGRFTDVPVLGATASSHYFFISAENATKTSATFAVTHIKGNLGPPFDVWGSWLGMQMLPLSAPGLMAAAAPNAAAMVSATATCHTDGCDNAEVPIPIEYATTDYLGDPVPPPPVQCGVCSQPITDLVGA